MSEGFARFSHYETPHRSEADETLEVEPSVESIEAAETAMELFSALEEQYADGGDHIGTDERMYELSALLRDPEVKKVFESRLYETRAANGWMPPSQRLAA